MTRCIRSSMVCNLDFDFMRAFFFPLRSSSSSLIIIILWLFPHFPCDCIFIDLFLFVSCLAQSTLHMRRRCSCSAHANRDRWKGKKIFRFRYQIIFVILVYCRKLNAIILPFSILFHVFIHSFASSFIWFNLRAAHHSAFRLLATNTSKWAASER